MMIFGDLILEKVHRLLVENKETVYEFENKSGLVYQDLKGDIRLDTINMLCEYFRIPMQELFDDLIKEESFIRDKATKKFIRKLGIDCRNNYIDSEDYSISIGKLNFDLTEDEFDLLGSELVTVLNKHLVRVIKRELEIEATSKSEGE